jgi:homopolymeric O-antigen transport system permease protein
MVIKSAFKIAILEIKNIYSKSIFGVLWFFINPLLFFGAYYFFCVEILGFKVLDMNKMDSFFYIAFGLSSFLFFSYSLLPACSGLIGSLDLFKNTSYDPFAYVLKYIFLALFSYIPIITLCVIIKSIFISYIGFWFILAFVYYLFLYVIFMLSIVLLASGISVFFRDLVNILQLVVYSIMFISPFGIRGIQLEQKSMIAYYFNPLNYFIVPFQEIIFFKSLPSLSSIIITTIAVIMLYLLSVRFFNTVKVYMSDHA